MYNREIECMEQYPYHVIKMNRARGGICCICEEGDFLLKEYGGNEKRIQLLQQVLTQCEEKGLLVDNFVFTKEKGLVGNDSYMGGYTVRRHIVGGANRTLISVLSPLRLCRTGTCRRLLTE